MNQSSMRCLAALLLRLMITYQLTTLGFYGASSLSFLFPGLSQMTTSEGWLTPPLCFMLLAFLAMLLLMLLWLTACVVIFLKADRLAKWLVPDDAAFSGSPTLHEPLCWHLLLAGLGIWFMFLSLPGMVKVLSYQFYQRDMMLETEWREQWRFMLPDLIANFCKFGVGLGLLLGRERLSAWFCRSHQAGPAKIDQLPEIP